MEVQNCKLSVSESSVMVWYGYRKSLANKYIAIQSQINRKIIQSQINRKITLAVLMPELKTSLLT